MSKNRPSLPTRRETAGWRELRQIGHPEARSAIWERGGAQVQWNATGHSSNDYARRTFTTRPYVAYTKDKGALTTSGGLPPSEEQRTPPDVFLSSGERISAPAFTETVDFNIR